jgi:hypothetical protein
VKGGHVGTLSRILFEEILHSSFFTVEEMLIVQ